MAFNHREEQWHNNSCRESEPPLPQRGNGFIKIVICVTFVSLIKAKPLWRLVMHTRTSWEHQRHISPPV